MSFVNPTRDFAKHKISTDLYVGTVVSNTDPLKLARIKVRVVEVFGSNERGISDEALPYSSPSREILFGANANLSSIAIPKVGSKIFVMFHKGSIYSPIYTGSPYSATDKINDVDTNYPNRYAMLDENGSKLIVDTQKKLFNYQHTSGTTIQINADGGITIKQSGDLNFDVGGDLNLRIAGDHNVDIAGSSRIRYAGEQSTRFEGNKREFLGSNSYRRNNAGTDFACPTDPTRPSGSDCTDIQTPASPAQPESL